MTDFYTEDCHSVLPTARTHCSTVACDHNHRKNQLPARNDRGQLIHAQQTAFQQLGFLARRQTSKQLSSRCMVRASAHTTCKCTGKTVQALISQPKAGLTNQRCTATRLNTGQIRRLYPFPPYRFHVLFNSLFKVLCNFPSQYLFAIGLVGVFSLR
jgi:hypothetical protein